MRFFLFFGLVLIYRVAAEDEQCQKPLDMVFLIDTSASVATEDFEKQREFILDVVQMLNVGPSNEQSRVAAITFSNTVTFQFKFHECESKECVLEKIKSLKHDQGDATRTYRALEQVYTVAFGDNSGERTGVENVVVVCTDGKTNPGHYYHIDMIQESGKFETLKQASEVKKIPASVFSIGIGQNVDMEELIGIASDPSDKYVIAVSDYDELNTEKTKQLLLTRTCKDAENLQKEQECTELRADVFFALDTSSSITTRENFEKELALVNEFIDQVKIGETKVQVGLLTFSTDATMQFHLKEYHTKTKLIDAINEKSYKVQGDTYINKAIDMLIDDGFNDENGARSDVPHIVVMVTDGKSTRQSLTDPAIDRLKKTSITTFAVGVGNQISMVELLKIASTTKHVFGVENMDKLVEIRKALVQHICAESPVKEEVPQKEEECKESKADIMFLVDSSSSIFNSETFKKELDFIVSVIESLDIDANLVRVGVMQFSDADKITVEIDITEYSNRQQLAEAVTKIKWMGGNTFLDKALETILTVMSPDKLRNGIPHIVILISDGQSTNPYQTKLQMKKVREKTDITFIAIGVGKDRKMEELESLATQPISQHVFDVDNQDALPGIRSKLLTTVCQADRPAAEVCASKEADIIFVADVSTSVGYIAFEKLKVFIMQVVKNFPIGPDNIQIGLITYSTIAKTEFELNQYSNVKDIEGAIDTVDYTTGDTYTHLALKKMLTNGFIDSVGARTGIPQIAILITDGLSREPDETLKMSTIAKEKGIILFCIGVGPYYNKTELEGIASPPLGNHIFMVDDYGSLENIKNSVASKACKAESIEKPLANDIGSSSTGLNNNFIAKKKSRKNGWDVSDQMNSVDDLKIDNLGHQLRGVSDDQDDRYTDDIRSNDYRQRNVIEKKNILALLKKVLEKENERRNHF